MVLYRLHMRCPLLSHVRLEHVNGWAKTSIVWPCGEYEASVPKYF